MEALSGTHIVHVYTLATIPTQRYTGKVSWRKKKKSLQHHTPQSIDAIRQTLKAMDVIFKKKYAIYYIGVISRVSTELSVYWY